MKRSVQSYLRSPKGVTLIELMIVVAIIGVLAALAVPRFRVFQAKAYQAEAKSNLSHLHTLEFAYEIDDGSYQTFCHNTPATNKYGMQTDGTTECTYATACPSFTNRIGFSIPGGSCNKVRYGYNVSVSGNTFSATAISSTGNTGAKNIVPGCTTADTHTMDQDRTLSNSPNAISSCN